MAAGLAPPGSSHPESFDFLMHRFLVAFEGQHVIGVGFDDFLGDFLLAAHRIKGDDTAAEFEHARSNSGTAVISLLLSTTFNAPSTRLLLSAQALTTYLRFFIHRPPQGFAVQGDNLLMHGLP